MRVTEEMRNGICPAMFVEDAGYNIVVECANCKEENLLSRRNQDKEQCSNCEFELVYRPWYEW